MTSKHPSILTRTHVNSIVTIAKANLEKDERLDAMLFVHYGGLRSRHVIVPLADLPADSSQRPHYFFTLRARLRQEMGVIDEALFLSNIWWAPITSPQEVDAVAPSQHPGRQETIMLVGRNVTNTHQALLIQPFTRDRHNAPVWDKVLVESYGQAGSLRAIGLLDDFFDANQQTPPST